MNIVFFFLKVFGFYKVLNFKKWSFLSFNEKIDATFEHFKQSQKMKKSPQSFCLPSFHQINHVHERFEIFILSRVRF